MEETTTGGVPEAAEQTNRSATDDERSIDELREEYLELNERKFSNLLEDEDHERMMEAWRELCRRLDVAQPECPECGARNWGFSDYTACLDCGFGPLDEDLHEEIQSAWNRIMYGGEDAC